MTNIFIISVTNNETIYNQAIGNNPHLAKCHITKYDNSQENLPIPTRYNHFIEHELNGQDGWIIFCHQDFEFLQNPEEILKDLDKNYVYGPIGVTSNTSRHLHLIFREDRKLRPSIRLRKHHIPLCLGQISHGPLPVRHLVGTKISKPTPVDTVDCCCLIAHSSLIRSANLRFDEDFDFHLYAEDFCLSAKKKGIRTCAVQCKCYHYSLGNINDLFWKKYQELFNKYPDVLFLTTCVFNIKQILNARIQDSLAKNLIKEYDISI